MGLARVQLKVSLLRMTPSRVIGHNWCRMRPMIFGHNAMRGQLLVQSTEDPRIMARIKHIALITSDPDKLAKFYCECFGMKIRQDYEEVPGTARAIFITDGYMEVALIEARRNRPLGINHFGFTLEAGEQPEIYEKIREHEIVPETANPDRPYVEDFIVDVDGNKVDLSTNGLRLDRDQPSKSETATD